MLAVARTYALRGIEARPVQVEVDVNRGLPAFSIVGLPDAAVREARERVRGALVNSGFEFPLRRITANLAPADLRKVGPGFDLAIAAALLVASGQLQPELLGRYAFVGELALDGSVRRIPGILAMAEAARGSAAGIAVASSGAPEAALVDGVEVVGLERLDRLGPLADGTWEPPRPDPPPARERPDLPDLSDLRGQPGLRHALEVAATGSHSLLMVGPPGSGKSLAARRLASLLPPLTRDEALEVTRIASACGLPPPGGGLAPRPYRAPHHTISAAGLVGGGVPPRAGQMTLAHGGVLFLDELGEFSRAALEALRQPLEDGQITIARASEAIVLPSRVLLVAAANPCPCGRGRDSEKCRCDPARVSRYEAKLSGPLADRIDISVRVDQPSAEAMAGDPGEASAAVRTRVVAARGRREERSGELELEPAAKAFLARSHDQFGLSGRGHERVIRLARTIADLDADEAVRQNHVSQALSLRTRDES